MLNIHHGLSQYSIWFPHDLKELFGVIFTPIGYMIGVPMQDIDKFGALFGTKISLNEFLAYADLSEYIKQGNLMPKTVTMATFALCGFANFSSIAIQIGGIGALIPERKKDIFQTDVCQEIWDEDQKKLILVQMQRGCAI
jgi:CNT family concentrative nucleoside transporter